MKAVLDCLMVYVNVFFNRAISSSTNPNFFHLSVKMNIMSQPYMCLCL